MLGRLPHISPAKTRSPGKHQLAPNGHHPSYASQQHLVQGATHRRLLCCVERIHGAHQNLERIAC